MAVHSSILAWKTPLTEKPDRPQSTGLQISHPACIDTRPFYCQWQLCPSEGWEWRWYSCLGHRDMDCLCHRTYGPIRVFFWASGSWWSKASLACLSLLFHLVRHSRGLPWPGSFSVFWAYQAHKGAPLAGVLLWFSVCQVFIGAPWVGSYSAILSIRCFDGPACLLFSCQCWLVGKERLWWWLHPLHMTQQYRLASMAAWHFPQAFPTTISSSCPLGPSLCPQALSTAALILGLLHKPYTLAPSCCVF